MATKQREMIACKRCDAPMVKPVLPGNGLCGKCQTAEIFESARILRDGGD